MTNCNSSTALAPAEASRLAQLETTIKAGLHTFVEVGNALREIRDNRLYREAYITFENYLHEKWGWSRAHGYRLIAAAGVAEAMSPMGDIRSERAARALAKVAPEDRPATLAKAKDLAKDEPVTNKHVETVIAEKTTTHASQSDEPRRLCFCGAPILHRNKPSGCLSAQFDRTLEMILNAVENLGTLEIAALRPEGLDEWARTIGTVLERLREVEEDLGVRDAEVRTENEDGAPRDGWRCPSCDAVVQEGELVVARECSRESCGTVFAATEGNNCPECNSPFTRKLHDHACPECGDAEGECEPVAEAVGA